MSSRGTERERERKTSLMCFFSLCMGSHGEARREEICAGVPHGWQWHPWVVFHWGRLASIGDINRCVDLQMELQGFHSEDHLKTAPECTGNPSPPMVQTKVFLHFFFSRELSWFYFHQSSPRELNSNVETLPPTKVHRQVLEGNN